MKLREIERLRGAAILMVVVHHMARQPDWPWLGALAETGWTGVDLFFVVSGFVVTASLLRALPGVGMQERWRRTSAVLQSFCLRRALRLFPLAWIWAGIGVALAALLGGAAFGSPASVAREALAVATLRYNYFAVGVQGERLSWYWSLAVEEHFYLVLPLLLAAVAGRRGRIALCVAAAAAVAFVLRPLAPDASRWEFWRYASHLRFDGLLVGVLVALVLDGRAAAGLRRRRSAAALSLCLVAAIGAFPALVPFSVALGVGSTLVAGLAAVLVVLAARDSGAVLAGPFAPALEWLGARSYALYLAHPLALRLALEAGGGHDAVSLGVFAALTFVAVEASHRFVEKPGIALGARLAARFAAAPEAPRRSEQQSAPAGAYQERASA